MPAAERALACELLALYTPRALEDAASPGAAAFAAGLASAAQAAPAPHPAAGPAPHAPASSGEGHSPPAETLLRLASADAGAVTPGGGGSGAAAQGQSAGLSREGVGTGGAAGPDVRAAALAQVTPELYAALPEALRAQLVLARTSLNMSGSKPVTQHTHRLCVASMLRLIQRMELVLRCRLYTQLEFYLFDQDPGFEVYPY